MSELIDDCYIIKYVMLMKPNLNLKTKKRICCKGENYIFWQL